MFDIHQPLISEYGRTSPDAMGRVLSFCILTIRARLFNIPSDMVTLEQPDSPDSLSGVLYGFKAQAIAQIEIEKTAIFDQAELIWHYAESERQAAESLLALFCGLYGFGIVKAGFACQLLYGVSGCIDGHNMERFSIPKYAFHSSHYKNAKTLATKRKYITKYCDLVERCGGTQKLWDSWCRYVYERPDKVGDKIGVVYESAFHVSALHCHALGLAG